MLTTPGGRSACWQISANSSAVSGVVSEIPPTENAEQVGVKKKIAKSKSMCDFGILGVVHQTNSNDILPMAKAGAIGYKIFFGETIGNLPYPDDGMCIEVFSNIADSRVPLCVHAESRQIQHYWTNKLKAEGKNDPVYWEQSHPELCKAVTWRTSCTWRRPSGPSSTSFTPAPGRPWRW